VTATLAIARIFGRSTDMSYSMHNERPAAEAGQKQRIIGRFFC